MIHTTTSTIQGKEIIEYLGIVAGEAKVRKSVLSISLMAQLSEARSIAVQAMNEKAADMGADAVIGIDMDHSVVNVNGLHAVTVVGTAVKVK